MTANQQRLAQMTRKLREEGYKITPQRIAILKVLSISEEHPTVEKVYEKVKDNFPTTSLATVYKNISILKELGEVLELGFSDDSNRYDGNKPYPHPHIVCKKCKRIIDPDIEKLKDISEVLSKETGFKIINHRLDFIGICPDCQKNMAEA
jgi:Fur family peroxide stress response transcriptional regulator